MNEGTTERQKSILGRLGTESLKFSLLWALWKDFLFFFKQIKKKVSSFSHEEDMLLLIQSLAVVLLQSE